MCSSSLTFQAAQVLHYELPYQLKITVLQLFFSSSFYFFRLNLLCIAGCSSDFFLLFSFRWWFLLRLYLFCSSYINCFGHLASCNSSYLTIAVQLYSLFSRELRGKLNALSSSLWVFGLNPQLSDKLICAGCPHQHLSHKSSGTVRRADHDSCWVLTCNCQTSRFVMGALFRTSRKSPATVRQAVSCWMPSSAPFSQVIC